MSDFKYAGLRNWLLNNIKNNRFKYGDKLPSENALQVKFSLSKQTVRRAVDELEKDGIVKRVHGSGMYVAKQLQEVRNKTIGVLASYVHEYIFPLVLGGMESELTKHGYGMDLGITYNRLEQERSFLERMLISNVSGLIVEGTKSGLPNPNLDLYEEFYRRQIPIVFTHNFYPGLKYPAVLMDDVGLARRLTQLLIELGHTKIAGLFKFDDLQGQRRYAGYVSTLTQAKIPVNDNYIGWFSTNTYDSIFRDQNMPLLNYIRQCTAVVCYNDQLAVKMYGYFMENGIRVPEDISMVGFDDQFSDYGLGLKLTSAKHPKEELGKKAASLLIEMIQSGIGFAENQKIEMETSIKLCESVRRITNNHPESDPELDAAKGEENERNIL